MSESFKGENFYSYSDEEWFEIQKTLKEEATVSPKKEGVEEKEKAVESIQDTAVKESKETKTPKEFSEAGRERLVKSFRERFKKAVYATALVTFASAYSVGISPGPDKIGFNKEDVSRMLNNQVQISSYIEAAKAASAEGEMEPEERQITAKAAREGLILQEELGQTILNEVIDAYPESAEKTAELKGINAEKLKKIGIDVETVQSTLNNLPEQWRKKIGSISGEEKIEKIPERYGLALTKEGYLTGAMAEYNYQTGITDITFFKCPGGWLKKDFQLLLLHETGHANDWRARYRNVPERINMMYENLKRVKSPDRFRSGYVESIKNPDKQIESSLKTVEYWAEIVKQYFSDKEQLSNKDQELVKQFMEYSIRSEVKK